MSSLVRDIWYGIHCQYLRRDDNLMRRKNQIHLIIARYNNEIGRAALV